MRDTFLTTRNVTFVMAVGQLQRYEGSHTITHMISQVAFGNDKAAST